LEEPCAQTLSEKTDQFCCFSHDPNEQVSWLGSIDHRWTTKDDTEKLGQNHVPSARQQSAGCAAADAVGALRAVLMGEVAEKPSLGDLGEGNLQRVDVTLQILRITKSCKWLPDHFHWNQCRSDAPMAVSIYEIRFFSAMMIGISSPNDSSDPHICRYRLQLVSLK